MLLGFLLPIWRGGFEGARHDRGAADIGQPPALQRAAGGGQQEAAAAGGGVRQQREEAAAPRDMRRPGPCFQHEQCPGAVPAHPSPGLGFFFFGFLSFFCDCLFGLLECEVGVLGWGGFFCDSVRFCWRLGGEEEEPYWW